MPGEGSNARWRRLWLAGLIALFAAQTALRIAFFSIAFYRSGIAIGLHLLVLASWLALVALAISHMPVRWRGVPVAAPLASLLLGLAQCFATVFDIVQMTLWYYTGLGAPMRLFWTNPKMVLSLLASIDITALMAFAALAALLVLHVLLYVPVAGQLVAAARRLVRGRVIFPVRHRRIKVMGARWLLIAVLAGAVLVRFTMPDKFLRLEYFRRGGDTGFMMAPRALTIGAPGLDAPQGPPEALPGARPVIVIVVDAMRRDRMGVYDPALDTTPFLDGLAREGTLHAFRGAYSTCSFSFCGIMSVLASRSWDNFTRRPPTILDALAHYGYRNHVILSGDHSDFGKLYELHGRGIVSRTEDPDDDALLRRLGGMTFPDPRHSFLYIHLMSAHAGKAPGPRYLRPPRPDRPGYARIYDGRLRKADEVLRNLFGILGKKGLLDDALIVITADHGERLGQRGTYYHGGPPDRDVTAIPLMIYDASRPAWPDRRMSSQIDIAPTILRALGGAGDPGWRGQALQDPSRIPAVPLGTEEMSGVVATIDGVDYRYRCLRSVGFETIERVDRDNDVVITPSPGLLARLRALHRQVAGPLPPGRCRR